MARKALPGTRKGRRVGSGPIPPFRRSRREEESVGSGASSRTRGVSDVLLRAFTQVDADRKRSRVSFGAPLPRMSSVACARVATSVMPGKQSNESYASDQRGSGPTAQRDNGFAGAHLFDDQHRRLALQRHHQVQSEGHGPAVQRNEYVYRLGAEQAGISRR